MEVTTTTKKSYAQAAAYASVPPVGLTSPVAAKRLAFGGVPTTNKRDAIDALKKHATPDTGVKRPQKRQGVVAASMLVLVLHNIIKYGIAPRPRRRWCP